MRKYLELSVGDLVRHVMDVQKGFTCPGVVIDIRKKEALVMWSPWPDSGPVKTPLNHLKSDPGPLGWHNLQHLTTLVDE